jgi:hypothetical protein
MNASRISYEKFIEKCNLSPDLGMLGLNSVDLNDPSLVCAESIFGIRHLRRRGEMSHSRNREDDCCHSNPSPSHVLNQEVKWSSNQHGIRLP